MENFFETFKVYLSDLIYWVVQMLKNIGKIDAETADKFTKPDLTD